MPLAPSTLRRGVPLRRDLRRAMGPALVLASVCACGRVAGDDLGSVGHRDDASAPDGAGHDVGAADSGADALRDGAEVGHEPFRVLWARQAHASVYADPVALTIAQTGDLVVAGELRDTIDLGVGPTTATSFSAYVARLSADGVAQWSTVLDGSPCRRAIGGATIAADAVWVAGASVGTGARCDVLGDPSAVGEADAWRFSLLDGAALGGPTAIASKGGETFLQTSSRAVTSLEDGTIVVLGGWKGTATFPDGSFDAAIGKWWSAAFATDGALLWIRRSEVDGADVAFGSVVAVDGGYVASGEFTGTIDLGTGPLTARAPRDAVLASFDRTGAIRWARRYDGSGLVEGAFFRLTRDKDGSLLGTVNATGVVTLGPTTLTTRGSDGVVVRFSPTGDVLAATLVGTDGVDSFGGAAIDDGGDVFVGGLVGLVESDRHVAIPGTSRAAIVRLSAALVERSRWTSVSYPPPRTELRVDSARAPLLVARGSTLFVAGSFTGDLTVGSTTLKARGLTSDLAGGPVDTFIAAFEP